MQFYKEVYQINQHAETQFRKNSKELENTNKREFRDKIIPIHKFK